MSTRDWKLGEVVYLKSGSPAMTVTGTDSHGATKVQWYDPQAVEVERSMYPTNVFPKDCLTETVTPVQDAYQRYGSMESPLRISAEPIRINSSDLIVAHQPSSEDLTQSVLTTLRDLFSRLSRSETSTVSQASVQPNEKIVEAMSRVAEPQVQRQASSQDLSARELREKYVASGALPDGAQPVQQPPRRKNS